MGPISITIALAMMGVGAAIGGSYHYGTKSRDKVFNQLMTLGKNLDLHVTHNQRPNLKFKYPKAYGHLDQKPVTVETIVVSDGNSNRIYTQVEVENQFPNMDHLTIYIEGYMDRIGKKFGMQDIEVGSADFDKLYVVKSNDELFARNILDPKICVALVNMAGEMKGKILYKKNKVQYKILGAMNTDAKRKHIERIVFVCLEMIKHIDEETNLV